MKGGGAFSRDLKGCGSLLLLAQGNSAQPPDPCAGSRKLSGVTAECPELERPSRITKVQLLSLHRPPRQSHPVPGPTVKTS